MPIPTIPAPKPDDVAPEAAHASVLAQPCAPAQPGGPAVPAGGRFRSALYGFLAAVAGAPLPVLASVQGPAIGAGTQLALAADLRVAGPTARFAVPTARLGLAVDPWTVRRLSLLAGAGLARAMLLGCQEVDADWACRAGLVQRLGDHDTALSWAREIARLAPLSLTYSKMALEHVAEPPFDDADVTKAFEACWSSADFAEGQRAFREKRPARFEGR